MYFAGGPYPRIIQLREVQYATRLGPLPVLDRRRASSSSRDVSQEILEAVSLLLRAAEEVNTQRCTYVCKPFRADHVSADAH